MFIPTNNLNYVSYVGDGTNRTGDIGAQINSAYAALPSSGGKIVINPSASGLAYDFSTPILLNVNNKGIILECAYPGQGATGSHPASLNYTPNSGSALTIDFSDETAQQPSSCGIINLTLVNNNYNTKGGNVATTAIGISVGLTNAGDTDCTFTGVTIRGFDVAYSNLNGNPTAGNAVDISWFNPTFLANRVAMMVLGGTERVFGATAVANANIFKAPSGTPQSEMYYFGLNAFSNIGDPVFDYNSVPGGSAAALELHGCHVELEPGSVTAHVVQGRVNLSMYGGVFENDSTTGGPKDWMIQPTNDFGFLYIVGTVFGSSVAYTNVVNLPNETVSHMSPQVTSAVNLPTFVGGSFATRASVFPIVFEGSTLQPWMTYQPSTFANQSTFNQGAVMGSATLGTTTTNGFLYIATTAGQPTGVPVSKTGCVPLVYDTTNHQFWIYDGSWKQPKTPAAAALVTWQ